MFRRDDRRADPRWEVAASTQVFSADRDTVVGLVRECDSEAGDGGLDGVLIARSHPTGWFISAVRRADLPDEDLACFHEVVTVRTYLLLRQGPASRVWSPVPATDEWRSAIPSFAVEVAGIAGDLAT